MKRGSLKLTIVTVSVLLAVVPFVVAKPVRVQTPDEKMQGALEAYGFPFAGPGRVVVLNDGRLLVQIGARIGRPGVEEISDFDAWETLVLTQDPQGRSLSLVNSGGEWFVDLDGAALAERGLTARDVLVIPLDTQGESRGCGRQSVFELEGVVRMEFSERLRSWHLQAQSEDGSEYFAHDFHVVGTAEQTSSPRSPVGCPEGTVCCVKCPKGGYCECGSGAAGGACFCGLFGEPECWCLARLFKIVTPDIFQVTPDILQ